MIQFLYNKSPIFIQEVFVNLYSVKAYCERYLGNYNLYKKQFLNQFLQKKDFTHKDQETEFKLLLKHAISKSKYYRELFLNIDVKTLTLDNLKDLPVLDKETLRNNISQILTSTDIVANTGGTTGKSLQVYFTIDDFRKRIAYLDAFKEWHGVKIGERAARFSGKNLIPASQKSTKFWRTNNIINQRLYSTFHMSEENLQYYVDDLNKFKPVVIDGFVTNIFELAKFIERHQIKLNFHLKCIFTTAETVLPHHREVIERTFKCKIRDQYASSEGAPFIVECKCGRYHYCVDTGIIEVIDQSTNEVAVTSFTSYGTPLIRYKIGDSIIFSNEKCECGLTYPVVKEIKGRNSDYLFSEQRGIIHAANLSNVIKYLPNAIKQIQFHQIKKNKVVVNVVFDDEKYMPSFDQLIILELKNRLGSDMEFELIKYQSLNREKSGKLRFIINDIK